LDELAPIVPDTRSLLDDSLPANVTAGTPEVSRAIPPVAAVMLAEAPSEP